jgi:hypothetical protein
MHVRFRADIGFADLTGPAANKCTWHAMVNHIGVICNKQAEAEK